MTDERQPPTGPPQDRPLEERAVELLRELSSLKTDGIVVARPLERVIARGIDLAAVVVAVVAIEFTFFAVNCLLLVRCKDWGDPSQPPPQPSPTTSFLVGLIPLAALVAYEVGVSAVWGQTLGKRLMGLHVRRARDQNGLGSPRMLVRCLLWAAPLSLGWLLAGTSPLVSSLGVVAAAGSGAALFFRRDRRSLHDLIAGTFVVRPR